ncbi:tetratricopeptide repeat protein [bacterium]|nr:tetratricopeptide repeat protein [bacterium]
MRAMPVLEWLMNMSNIFVMVSANLMVQSTIIITFGLFVVYALRHKSAAIHSLIFRMFLAAVFLCPLVSLTIDSMGIQTFKLTVPTASLTFTKYDSPQVHSGQADGIGPRHSMSDRPLISSFLERETDIGSPVHPLESLTGINQGNWNGRGSSERGEPWRAIFYMVLTVVWTGFSLFLLIRLAFSYFRILYVRNSAVEAEPGIIAESEIIASELEIDRPAILQSGLVNSPFLTGIFKPAVLLPEGITITREILLHEFAHLVRRDCFWNLLSNLGIVFLPLQPLMKLLNHHLEDSSDYVCDDYVLKHGRNSVSYARQLVSLAENFIPEKHEIMVGVGIISFKSSLLRRVERILEDSRQIIVHTRFEIALMVIMLSLGTAVATGLFGFRENGSFTGVSEAQEGIKISGQVSVTAVPEKQPVPVETSTVADSRNRKTDHEPESAAPVKTAENVTDSTSASRSYKAENSVPEQKKPVIAEKKSPAISPDKRSDLPVPQTAGTPEKNTRVTPNEIQRQTDSKTVSSSPSQPSEKEPKNLYAYSPQTTSEPEKEEVPAVPVTEKTDDEVLLDTLQDLDSCITEGKKLLDTGNYALAEKVFLKASEYKPDDSDLANYLGKAYFGKREYDLARIYFRKAILFNKNNADAYFNLGDILFEQGNLDKAMKQYKIAIKINPAMASRTRPFDLGEAVRRVYK